MRNRIGIVLGAGGTLGAAWMVGVLHELQNHCDRPLGEADVVVGTSAGSILAAALRHGAQPSELVAQQRGAPTTLPGLHHIDRDTGLRPPRLRVGSPHLLAAAALRPHRVHPRVAASALMPVGRATLHGVAGLVRTLQERHGGRSEPAARRWPDRDTWIVAVDYRSGQRVAFGRPGAPDASLPDAVVASCSIPGWFEPKSIGRREFVDGGVRSAASVDLLAGAKLDHVYVLAPMASHESDAPRGAAHRTERFVRRCIAGFLDQEARRVEATGTRVSVVTPGADDLAAMGINLMDHTRRRAVLETALHTAGSRIASAHGRRSRRR